ncbi:MAG TPA: hypothetical protein PK649_11720 [Vicingus sp.]|nr:hypothetical protein [Vicingus sp.]
MLKVTLNGTQSGAYNDLTDTWEVESEPCADATYTIKDRDETTLYSGSISSGGNLNQYIENTTVEVNDSSFADVPAQGSINIQVVNTENTQKGSKVGSDWLLPNININKSDSTLIATIPSVKDYNVADSAITVNGNAYANVKATDSLDVAVEYSDSTNVGDINAGVVEIPDNRFNTASITKTGQTTSYGANDDGALQRGSGVDFLTLSYNNPFGNTSRFTDSAGGQTYANGEAYDWANADYVNRLVPVWYLTPQTAATWANAMANQPYTINSQNWYIPNKSEANTLINDGVAGSKLNYAPFNITSSVSGGGFWTSTTNENIVTRAFAIVVDASLAATIRGLGIYFLTKTNSANFLLIRYESF